jgi:hypothetical protein
MIEIERLAKFLSFFLPPSRISRKYIEFSLLATELRAFGI